jgi:hypothetical protein
VRSGGTAGSTAAPPANRWRTGYRRLWSRHDATADGSSRHGSRDRGLCRGLDRINLADEVRPVLARAVPLPEVQAPAAEMARLNDFVRRRTPLRSAIFNRFAS